MSPQITDFKMMQSDDRLRQTTPGRIGREALKREPGFTC